ncbi:hypothetical protein GBAR_LOCUS1740 [Geodia barretti]|uniref:Uncharacterized protein n=1 Tax=Geodia barretti TaxID=519541 RepID=A0AA35QX92_GEOBA|nr:hypothetical protein GBAR_LOCUS1740 [Geodia barretti]
MTTPTGRTTSREMTTAIPVASPTERPLLHSSDLFMLGAALVCADFNSEKQTTLRRTY